MLWTVNYTKTNSFMKSPKLKNKRFEDGHDVITESQYGQPSMPKSYRLYSVPQSYKKNQMVISCEQKELNELVEQIGFYDETGNIIKTAPIKNPNAPFWKHTSLRLILSNAGTTLDDENPLDQFWLYCFESDRRFSVRGQKLPPSIQSLVEYTVTKVSDTLSGKDETLDEGYEAIKLLTSNEEDYEKLVSILRAMGTDVKKANPKLVRDSLFNKITKFKDAYVRGGNERNIEMFIRLASATTKDREIGATITVARTRGFIKKNAKNEYSYGDLIMGTSLDRVEMFLNQDENTDILNELLEKTKDA